ncbi:MAG: 4,5-DOPA dioxygenase extradiol [Candidatus Omnitrophica bacterium]|nr:4,5-DOPA dioxygenase extradiol [Candidatus Omnitrophota bacterium]
MNKTMPAIFFGHGNPMNAVTDNAFAKSWEGIGAKIPTPKAILCVSAHWYLPETAVTAMPSPRTIHDFGGFPKKLFDVQYPAPGAPDLAGRVKDLLVPASVGLDTQWGLDHGTWSVLCRVFPKANIPVVQLSIDERQPPSFHYEMGRKLACLREQGVLIIGSGNIVHNLQAYAWGEEPVEPYDWAVRFDKKVRTLVTDGNDRQLIEYEKLGKDARLSIPTPEHYLPLLYILALRRKNEPVTFPVEGFDGGSMSMLAVQFG